MICQDVKINLPQDAEARPVAVLVQIASKYDSKINFIVKEKRINAKSIMGMMSLGFTNGDELVIEADGFDEGEALKELTKYIQSVD